MSDSPDFPVRRRRWLATLLVWLPALLVLLPAGVVVFRAFEPGAEMWRQVVEFRLGGHVRQTLVLVVSVTSPAILLGVPAAWCVSVYQFPGRRGFEWLLLLPLAMPGFVAAVAMRLAVILMVFLLLGLSLERCQRGRRRFAADASEPVLTRKRLGVGQCNPGPVMIGPVTSRRLGTPCRLRRGGAANRCAAGSLSCPGEFLCGLIFRNLQFPAVSQPASSEWGEDFVPHRAAIIYTIVECAKRHSHNPEACLTVVLERLASHDQPGRHVRHAVLPDGELPMQKQMLRRPKPSATHRLSTYQPNIESNSEEPDHPYP